MEKLHREPPELFQRFCGAEFQGLHRHITGEDDLITFCLTFIRPAERSELRRFVESVLESCTKAEMRSILGRTPAAYHFTPDGAEAFFKAALRGLSTASRA